MNNRALEVVEEFLQSPNAQERCNASMALAIIGIPDSLQRLIHTAMSDADTAVRTRAEEELGGLREALAEEAGRQLAAYLHHRESGAAASTMLTGTSVMGNASESEAAAYALLARMSALGNPLVDASSTGGWLTRLRRAVRFIAANPARFSRLRLASISLFGMLILGMLVGFGLVIATGLVLSSADAVVVLLLSAVFTSGLVFTAVLRSMPMAAHFDRHAAIVVELLAAALGYGLLGLVVYGFIALVEPTSFNATWDVPTLTAVLIVTGMSIRLGVFLASGMYRPPYNFFFQAIVGSAWGTVTATLLLAPLSTGGWVAAASFSPLVLTGFGFAVAVSWIDAVPPIDRLLPRRAGVVAIAILVFVAAAGWMMMRPDESTLLVATGSKPVTLSPAASGRQVQEVVAFDEMPIQVYLETRFPQWVQVGLLTSFGQDLEMRLDNAARNELVDSYDDPEPPRIRRFLSPGTYRVVVGKYARLNDPPSSEIRSGAALGASELLPALVGNHWGTAGRYRLAFNLNADGATDTAQQ